MAALSDAYRAEAAARSRPVVTFLHLLRSLGDPADPAFVALLEAAAEVGLDPEHLATLPPATIARVTPWVMRNFDRRGGFARYPDVWLRWQAGEQLWSGQRAVLRDLAVHRRVAVHSAFGVGKSHLAARAVAWWLRDGLDNGDPSSTFVVTSAPTYAQVRAILWREIRSVHAKAGLPGRVNMVEWLLPDDSGAEHLVAIGRKPADHDQAAMQGIHALRVLVVLDEAGGIPPSLFDDAEKLVTTAESRLLAIGNPTLRGSHWDRVCSPDSGWVVHRIDAYDVPSIRVARGLPLAPGDDALPDDVLARLTSPLWLDETVARWGAESAEVQRWVHGRFTSGDPRSVVPFDAALACVRRPDQPTPPPTPSVEVQLGVDIGAGGDDPTVIRERVGSRAGRLWTETSGDPQVVAAAIGRAVAESRPHKVAIDSTGVGFGIVGLVRQAHPDLKVIAVDFGAGSRVFRRRDGETVRVPIDGEVPDGAVPVFFGLRDELWWAARERSMLAASPGFRATLPGVAEPWDLTAIERDEAGGPVDDDPTLIELTTPLWETVVRGGASVIKVEAKASLAKAGRLGRSTDHADALLLAFADEPAVAEPPPAPARRSVLDALSAGPPAAAGIDRVTVDNGPTVPAHPRARTAGSR